MTIPSCPTNGPNHAQTMLNKMRAYAQRKLLTVNTQKSKVMCFNSHTDTVINSLCTASKKHLGMVCDRHIHLNTAADAALRPFTASNSHIKQFTREHGGTNRLHVYMWLLKTYAIPTGMFASQVWATSIQRIEILYKEKGS